MMMSLFDYEITARSRQALPALPQMVLLWVLRNFGASRFSRASPIEENVKALESAP
ncbi:hypothetical protein [Paenibacillus sp. sgz302251]|uniref:hypothetical protein n=1 Tax=Paenibacillus sp. sgz302251 TaxID=3414493 RepID=UPI003C79C1FD